MSRFYKDFSNFLAQSFPGKMQKLTIDAAFSCPNRDGTIGRGGCVYCNNLAFSPSLAKGKSVSEQLEQGKKFFSRKYPQMRYLAYFQSYTSTHDIRENLLALYREALDVDWVDGLIIGTRPDCVNDELLRDISSLGAWTMMEYGVETSHNRTLKCINRCHDWEAVVRAVRHTKDAGLKAGVHLIMGLPGETEEDMMQTVERVLALDVDTVKLHQLQIVQDTVLAREVEEVAGVKYFRGERLINWSMEEYSDFCIRVIDFINNSGSTVAIERFLSQSPPELLVWPRWGCKNYEFVNLIERKLAKRFQS